MTMNKPLVILASARSTGNTWRAVTDTFGEPAAYELIDLNLYDVLPYDYAEEPRDDFLKIIEVVQSHSTVVFATPVYWYSMSAPLKVFFDRLSDLTRRHKSIGRALSGKRMFVLTTGTDRALPPGFDTPFEMTAKYFSMHYLGSIYFVFSGDSIVARPSELAQFAADVVQPQVHAVGRGAEG